MSNSGNQQQHSVLDGPQRNPKQQQKQQSWGINGIELLNAGQLCAPENQEKRQECATEKATTRPLAVGNGRNGGGPSFYHQICVQPCAGISESGESGIIAHPFMNGGWPGNSNSTNALVVADDGYGMDSNFALINENGAEGMATTASATPSKNEKKK